jgi:aminoglycoside phosphotransferase (APT) family kinase protein
MTARAIVINADLVRQLIQSQCSRWAALPIRAVAQSGWDNRSFRLGEDMLVRLPSAQAYSKQVEREHRWLPLLAPALTLPIPAPLALGEPGAGYPLQWSVYRWLEGETAQPDRIGSLLVFAQDLAAFLCSLQSAPAQGGHAPGPDTFHRGGSLAVYDHEVRGAIAALASQVNTGAATAVWEAALASRWARLPVWVHGDMGVGNLLVRAGRLCGVIDFGQFCVGDPACDLVPAWTLFNTESRAIFKAGLALDDTTWARGRGWALWKALIVAALASQTNAWEGTRCWNTIESVLSEAAGAA